VGVRLAARAREELALCVRTEAGVRVRAERMRGGAAPMLPLVLRPERHDSSGAAWAEVAALLRAQGLDTLVGCDLLVHWPLDRRWYRCRVLAHDGARAEGHHQVRYEADGMLEWLDLEAEVWRLCPASQQPAANAAASAGASAGAGMQTADALAPNRRAWVPPGLHALGALHSLGLAQNRLVDLPPQLGASLGALRDLDVRCNPLSADAQALLSRMAAPRPPAAAPDDDDEGEGAAPAPRRERRPPWRARARCAAGWPPPRHRRRPRAQARPAPSRPACSTRRRRRSGVGVEDASAVERG
jgi:hypothetical protein